MEKEILTFTDKYECQDIAFGDNPDFKVIEDKVIDTSRWSIFYEVIVKRISDGKYFRSFYSTGATECQDQVAYENDDLKFTQVTPVEKVVIEYI